MRPYAKDLRLRVVQAYEHHEGSRRQLATRFRLSLSCVRALLTRYRTPGDVAPKPHGGGSPAKLNTKGLEARKILVYATPAATLQELLTRLATTQQLTVSTATISQAFTTLGRPRNKNLARRRARAARGPTATGRVSRDHQTARS